MRFDRKTPVAFSTIPAKKIEEELAGQDIPMLLNSTPGVYATQQGGGDGDARINIRGFNQRNIAVMIDGIPVIGRKGSQIDLSQINLSNIDRIEILKGPASVMYGTNSTGGVINLISKKNLNTITEDESR